MNKPCTIDGCELNHCRKCGGHMLCHGPEICDTCELSAEDGYYDQQAQQQAELNDAMLELESAQQERTIIVSGTNPPSVNIPVRTVGPDEGGDRFDEAFYGGTR